MKEKIVAIILKIAFYLENKLLKKGVLWRGSARLYGISCVDFNVLSNYAAVLKKLGLDTNYQYKRMTEESEDSIC